MKKIIGLALISLFSSCVPAVLAVDTSCSQYRYTEFNVDLLESNRVAVLPVQGVQSKEQFRKPLGRELSNSCINKFGTNAVVTSDEVTKLLSEQNLVNNYANGIRDYKTTGVLSSEYLSSISAATNCEFALFIEIVPEEENVVIATNRYGSATSVASITELIVEAQVWNLKNGDIVWEGKGGYAYLHNRIAINGEELISKVNQGLMSVIGQEKSTSCQTRDVLVKAESDAYMQALYGLLGASLLLVLIL